MIKNAQWIRSQEDLITPLVFDKVRHNGNHSIISYGCSGFGYDIRLSSKQFKVFRHIPGEIINPKNFNPHFLYDAQLQENEYGQYFILPHHSYALGVALEYIEIPNNIEVLFIGKSTYARCGIIVNMTPGEACLSDDTEILTDNGWKAIKNVSIGELVLTLNTEKEIAEYQPIDVKYEYHFNGEMLHFHSKYVDQLVTPQHRMWTGKRHRRVKTNEVDGRIDKQKGITRKPLDGWDYDFIEAQDLYGKWNYYLSRYVNWKSENKIGNVVKIGKYEIKIEDWCKFIGAWMGDGSAFDNGNGNYIIKLAVVSKTKKREYFRNLLLKMKVNFQESEYGFSFQDKAVFEYLLPYKYAHNKHIPIEIKMLPKELLMYVIEGMMHSDGNIETNTYFTVSQKLINDFQEICLKTGYNATVWSAESYSEFTKTNTLMYKCRYSKQNTTPNKLHPINNMEKVAYNGNVYDVTVGNHIFMIRRNGKASWTGNSWRGHLTIEISNSSDADAMIYANEGICQALFFEGEPTDVLYGNNKYQNQSEEVTLARV